ncbi:MAG: GIY-YIG nuclease family protein [Nanobdellota archaeon]
MKAINETRLKGVYLLIISVKEATKIKIGALGKINFEKGKYCYVGSAQNNLKKRIERHLSKEKNIRWHIDYLLQDKNSLISEIYYKQAQKEKECKTAQQISKENSFVKDFGSSDCRCASHLFKLKHSKLQLNNMHFRQYFLTT